jgi:hypothetical protein
MQERQDITNVRRGELLQDRRRQCEFLQRVSCLALKMKTGNEIFATQAHRQRLPLCSERLKTKKSKSAIAMAPLLAHFLKEWQWQTLYATPTDWVFASYKEKSRIPRVGNMLVSDYLRPAAVKAGVCVTAIAARR